MSGPERVVVVLRIEVEVEQARWMTGLAARRNVPRAPELAEIVDLVERCLLLAPLIRRSGAAVLVKLAKFPAAPASPGHVRASVLATLTISVSGWTTETGLDVLRGTTMAEAVRTYVLSALSQASQFIDVGATIEASIVDQDAAGEC